MPLLRAHAALPFDVLRAAVKVLGAMAPLPRSPPRSPLISADLRRYVQVLGAMAHRASARKLMHDPASAEGLMSVLSHPDSSEARPATAIITAIDALNDVNTLANLLAASDDGTQPLRWPGSQSASLRGRCSAQDCHIQQSFRPQQTARKRLPTLSHVLGLLCGLFDLMRYRNNCQWP